MPKGKTNRRIKRGIDNIYFLQGKTLFNMFTGNKNSKQFYKLFICSEKFDIFDHYYKTARVELHWTI